MTVATELRDQAAQTAMFNDSLANFLDLITDKTEAHRLARFPSLNPKAYSIQPGQRFVRVVLGDGNQASVHCFVEKATGKIVKAAGYRAPAKRSNGELQSQYSIYDLEPVAAAFDPYGSYLYAR